MMPKQDQSAPIVLVFSPDILSEMRKNIVNHMPLVNVDDWMHFFQVVISMP
jgi:hypothetical protein